MFVKTEIEQDLRKLITADFGKKAESGDVRNLLIDWLHFKARTIPNRPRQVIVSDKVRNNLSAYPAITQIRSSLMIGNDLSPWLSTSIRSKKTNAKADMMFNAWQILHFHLGNVFVGQNKIKRTGELLFAYITGEKAILLDIGNHKSWSQKSLLETLLETSEPDMAMYELKGVTGLRHYYDDKDIAKLRKSQINPTMEIMGRYFFSPGMGISTSGHAMRFVRFADRVFLEIEALEENIRNNTFHSAELKTLKENLFLPVVLGITYQNGQFIIFDKNRNLDFLHSPALK